MPERVDTGRHTLPDYSHISLAAGALAPEIGIHDSPGAVEDFIRDALASCVVFRGADGVPSVVNQDSGKPMKDWALTDYRARKPHMWPQKAPEDMEFAAFGPNPSLTARGALMNVVGKAEYAALAKKWGSDPVKLTPGKRPGDGEAPAAPKTKSKNPWSKEGWDILKQRSLVASVGVARAASIAASCGGYIGQTRFGAKRLIPR